MHDLFNNQRCSSKASEILPIMASMALTLIPLFCAFLLILTTSCDKKISTYPAQLLGQEPVVAVMENSEGGAFIGWAQNGYKAMTVIHAGVRSGLEPIPDERMKEIAGLVKSKNWDALKGPALQQRGGGSRINGSNYLSAGLGLGIVKSIYWVIPHSFFESAGGGEKARQFLVDSGLVRDRSEADRFRLAGACLAGSLGMAEITVCAPDTLLLIREPVLLDLDMDFIPIFAQSRGKNLLESFKMVMDALFVRRYKIAGEVNISSLPAERPFTPALAYVGSQVREAFKNPSVMQQAAAPPLWKARDEGDVLLRERDFRRAYESLKTSLKEFGPDNGLRALLASAALQRGKDDEALTVARDLCVETKADCGLLLYLGGVAADAGRPERATVFYQTAIEIMPDCKLAKDKLTESKDGIRRKGVQQTL